jgi:hypothetical protein
LGEVTIEPPQCELSFRPALGLQRVAAQRLDSAPQLSAHDDAPSPARIIHVVSDPWGDGDGAEARSQLSHHNVSLVLDLRWRCNAPLHSGWTLHLNSLHMAMLPLLRGMHIVSDPWGDGDGDGREG